MLYEGCTCVPPSVVVSFSEVYVQVTHLLYEFFSI